MHYADSVPIPDNMRPVPPTLVTRLFVLAVVLFALFFQLGQRALNEPDEGRYAEVGREMMASGDWLTPHVNDIPHLSKPPLTYWSIAASLRLFGVNEFAARLPAALAALGTLLALYLMVRDVADETAALWAVVMLTSSALFFLVARLITADMMLTCWITWSVWALWRRSNWLFVFLALGVLTKGPVAFVLPLFAMIGLRPRLHDFRWGTGLLFFLAIAAPWFIMLAVRTPDLWRYFFLREIVQRVATNEHGRGQAWWFLIPVLIGGFLPWTFLVIGLRRFDAPARMFSAWAGLGIVMFSVSQSKLPTYVLPLMPPLAALAALSQPRRWLNALTSLGLAGALIGVAYYLQTRCSLPKPYAIALDAIAILGATLSFVNRLAVASTFLTGMLAVVAVMPGIERQLRHNTSAKFLATRILREDPHREALIVTHQLFMRGMPFYLQSPVWWYNPCATNQHRVFEFDHPPTNAPHLITDLSRYRELLGGTQRVFCVASPDDAEKMRQLTNLPLHELERAGMEVLLSNGQ